MNLLRQSVAVDRVALLGALIGVAAFPLGWVTLKPNRLSSGDGLFIWEAVGWGGASLIAALLLISAVMAVAGVRWRYVVMGVAANALLVATFMLAGHAAVTLTDGEPLARLSLSGGVWLSLIPS